jgi:hypothetical protein
VLDRFQRSSVKDSKLSLLDLLGSTPNGEASRHRARSSMARNHDWSYGDSGGAEHDTKWVIREDKHSTRMQLVRLTELTTAEVTDDVRCRGSDGIMARQRFDCLVFSGPGPRLALFCSLPSGSVA